MRGSQAAGTALPQREALLFLLATARCPVSWPGWVLGAPRGPQRGSQHLWVLPPAAPPAEGPGSPHGAHQPHWSNSLPDERFPVPSVKSQLNCFPPPSRVHAGTERRGPISV